MHLFTDSFDGYSALDDFLNRWASKGASGIAFNASGGRFGGGCAEFTSGNVMTTRALRTSYDAAGTMRMSVAFAFKASAVPSAAINFLTFQDYRFGTAGTNSIPVRLNSSGRLDICDWGSSSNNQRQSSTNIGDGQWHWIEIDHYAANSGGLFRVAIDGRTEISFSGDTYTGTGDPNLTDRLAFGSAAGTTISIDDLIVYDDIAGTTAGDLRSSVNWPLGDRRISLISPDGAGSSTDFSASAGSNYQCVDETVTNSDTDYVQSATVGHDDLYAFAAMPVTPTTVTGVAVSMWAKYTNTGGPDIKGKTKSSAATATGAAKTLSAAYLQSQEFFAQDPNTSTAWTESGVNAAEFGVELA